MRHLVGSGKTSCHNCRVSSSRAYGGVSADQRRAQRRAALIAAGIEILGTQGHARVTVGGLCAQAGLNERYFYESFDSSEAVLLAVFDEVMAELTAAIVSAVATAPEETRAKARAAIAAAVGLLTDDPRKTRIVFVEPLAAPALNSRRAEVGKSFVALIVAQAHEFYGPETARRIGTWGDFAAAYLLGGLAETMTSWVRGDLAISREDLVDRSTELFVLVADHVVGVV
jgi:AcrR family transcriptional regulator